MQAKNVIDEVILSNNTFMEGIKPTKKYNQLLKEYTSLYDELKNNLTEPDAVKLKRLNDIESSLEEESIDQHFIVALKLGFRLAVECLLD